MGYLRPVDPTGICTYRTHTRRTTPSSEAGVDYYCPIGTPIRAAADGVIYQRGGSILAATGRYIAVDLDDGRRVRYLHLSRYATATGGTRVGRGEVIGYSGASGYGSEFFGASSLATIPANTGGPHVHTTLWAGHYYQFGKYPLEPTLDFELYVGGSTAGSNSTPFIPAEEALIVNQDDKDWLNGLGQSIIDQIKGPVRSDIDTVHQSVNAVRADLNYVHQLSPYSLKTILEATRGGTVTLTPEQVAAISGQLSASAVAGIDAALKDDFDGVKALIAKQPPEFVAALKAAL